MKTKYIMIVAAVMAYGPLAAQETYENAKIVTEELNGTARYVATGGALDALGAELSTSSTNPAGIGLFRHSKVEGSIGMVMQQDASDYEHGDDHSVSFDQAGFVYANRTGDDSFFNFAFNYHKSRNFNYILSAADKLDNSSQNKLSYVKLANGNLYPFVSDNGFNTFKPYLSCNQLDDIYTNNLFYASGEDVAYYYPATEYLFDRAHEGYVGEYDFTFSGNIKDRVYLGLTASINDVHYSHVSDHTEAISPNPENIDYLNVYDRRDITGTGVGLKAGVIFRPVEYAPLLMGLSISTPIWYRLTSSNYTEVSDGNYTVPAEESYKYKVFTPWKFGANIGYTVDQYLALGVTYEFADYSAMNNRINDNGDYYYYENYESSHADRVMNDHTKRTLRGVNTLKVGAEVKPIPEIAIRAGYNYVSPMYKSSAFKDGTLDSNGSYYASATDFTNWKATNRFTCGLGFRYGQLNFDLAYQYSKTDGDFYPFMSYIDKDFEDWNNVAGPVKVSNKRHQILCSVGYTF